VSTEGKGELQFKPWLQGLPYLMGSGNISFEGLGKDHTINSIGKD
jgi:hypothetical protein